MSKTEDNEMSKKGGDTSTQPGSKVGSFILDKRFVELFLAFFLGIVLACSMSSVTMSVKTRELRMLISPYLCKFGLQSFCKKSDSWVLFNEKSQDPQIARLSKWVQEECPEAQGMENLYLGEFNKGGVMVRGVGAKKSLNADTFFICLPKQCWFGEHNMFWRYRELAKKYPGACDAIQFTTALFLADEKRKGTDSFYKPYFSVFPTKEDYMQYHPAFLRDSAEKSFIDCKVKEGCPVDSTPDDCPECEEPFTGEGTDANYYWDLWYGWLGDCYDKYLEEYNNGAWNSKIDIREFQRNAYTTTPSATTATTPDDPHDKYDKWIPSKGNHEYGPVGSADEYIPGYNLANPVTDAEAEKKKQAFINLGPLTRAEVEYAYVVTMTRDFEGVGNMPIIDLPNADDHSNTHQRFYNADESVYCLSSEHYVKKGEEINVNYAQANKNPWIMFSQYAFALSADKHEKGTPRCEGLGPDSDVHKCQNPVACNFSAFAKRYCNEEYMQLAKEIDDQKTMREAQEEQAEAAIDLENENEELEDMEVEDTEFSENPEQTPEEEENGAENLEDEL